MNKIEALNRALFLQINGGDGTPIWLLQLAIGIADGLIYLIPLLLLGMWLWGDQRRRGWAVKACLVAMLGVGMNQVIGLGHAWIPHAADSSFPSDHMTVFAGVGLTLLFNGATSLAAITLLMGLCIAWARVFLGVHFPLDMVGAVVVAAVSHVVVSLLWRIVGNALMVLTQQLYRKVLARPIAAGWLRR